MCTGQPYKANDNVSEAALEKNLHKEFFIKSKKWWGIVGRHCLMRLYSGFEKRRRSLVRRRIFATLIVGLPWLTIRQSPVSTNVMSAKAWNNQWISIRRDYGWRNKGCGCKGGFGNVLKEFWDVNMGSPRMTRTKAWWGRGWNKYPWISYRWKKNGFAESKYANVNRHPS